VVCSDVQESLISLYQGIQSGWDPPLVLSEEEYKKAKALPESNPLHAFAAFGCSFGGKRWGGYARSSRGHNFAGAAGRALLMDVPLIHSFHQMSFFDVMPCALPDFSIYCDPPYQNTTGYGMAFDHERFFGLCEQWASFGVPVLVSEYSIDRAGWTQVWEKTYKPGLRGSSKTKTDRLYLV